MWRTCGHFVHLFHGHFIFTAWKPFDLFVLLAFWITRCGWNGKLNKLNGLFVGSGLGGLQNTLVGKNGSKHKLNYFSKNCPAPYYTTSLLYPILFTIILFKLLEISASFMCNLLLFSDLILMSHSIWIMKLLLYLPKKSTLIWRIWRITSVTKARKQHWTRKCLYLNFVQFG